VASALRAWSTLLSWTKTCTWCSFSIKRLIGPTAKLLGPLAYVSIGEFPPISTTATNWKTRDFGRSLRPFGHASACPYIWVMGCRE